MKPETKDDKLIGRCVCGYEQEIKINVGEHGKKDNIAKGIYQEKENEEGFPHVCPKCGHTQSDVHDLGAPYSDESNVYLFKCKKCKHVERQADGSGNG